jgi:NAD(P)-dependent dehydrogenase (short-subunit alcohol dehydrogenase family)
MSAAAPAAGPSKVLVTGASRGIGAAIARALLASGARVALVGRDWRTLQAMLASHPGSVALVADLTARDQVAALADRAVAALDGLDGFVSCAGVVEYAPVSAISEASLERQLTVNFTAPFVIAQRSAEHIAASGGGAMLFVASTLGLQPAPLTAAYAASKAALISLTKSLALELGPRAIRVNALAPGVVDTDMVRVVRPPAGDQVTTATHGAAAVADQLETLRKLHPLGRLGRPADIASSALYLLRTPYVTGSVMLVDGGLSLGAGRP